VRVGLIGAGAMGSAMVRVFEGFDLLVCDRCLEKIEALGVENGFTDPNEMIPQVDIVVFAVKPQSFKALVASIVVDMADKAIVSVMAGITIVQLKATTGSEKIVRCMPNIAVQVGKGVTAWTATEAVNDDLLQFIQETFSRFGVVLELLSEDQVDAVTAISGSGPAYFFILTEALATAAVKMGIPPEQARLLAENTLVGSGELMNSGNRSGGEWKSEIMVSGGTTEAGIKELERRDFDQIVTDAAEAARRRAKDLSV